MTSPYIRFGCVDLTRFVTVETPSVAVGNDSIERVVNAFCFIDLSTGVHFYQRLGQLVFKVVFLGFHHTEQRRINVVAQGGEQVIDYWHVACWANLI